jgi:hypothetical protein
VVAENLSNSYEKKYKNLGRVDFLVSPELHTIPTYNSIGKYWTFDGSDDFLSTHPGGLKFNTPTTFSTLSIWIKINALSSGETTILFTFLDRISNDVWYMSFAKPTNDTIYVITQYDSFTGDDYAYVLDTRVNTGQWLNICFVNIGQTVGKSNFYVNGELLDNNVEAGYTNSQELLYIGTNIDNNANFLSADISNFMIYNRALNDSEVIQNYNAIKYRFGL